MKTYLITIKLDNGDFKLITIESINMQSAINIFNSSFDVVTPEIYQITLIS